jgi:hypothetical protein
MAHSENLPRFLFKICSGASSDIVLHLLAHSTLMLAALMLAALMIGHHFSIPAFCDRPVVLAAT